MASHGEIFEYLALCGAFSQEIGRFYFRQLIDALDYCHQAGYAHRDLKPENILLDAQYNLKLADFGFAKLLAGKNNSGKMETYCGTETYMAPEIHRNESYVGSCVDIFSAGVMLYIFCAAAPPFQKAHPSDFRWKNFFLSGKIKEFWMDRYQRANLKFPDTFRHLVAWMLHPVPTKRPTMAEIKSHAWYTGAAATHAQVYQSFLENRQHIVDEHKQQEEKERQEKKDEEKIGEVQRIEAKSGLKYDSACWVNILNIIIHRICIR